MCIWYIFIVHAERVLAEAFLLYINFVYPLCKYIYELSYNKYLNLLYGKDITILRVPRCFKRISELYIVSIRLYSTYK